MLASSFPALTHEKTLRFRKASETMMAQIYSGTIRTAPLAALAAIAA
jgi:hypothetical protein